MSEVLLSTGKAAKAAGVSTDTVRRWLQVGVPMYGRVEFLGGYQIGTHWRIPEPELQRFLVSIQTTPRARSAVSGHRPSPGRGVEALAKALASLKRGKATPRRLAHPVNPGSTP